MCRIVLFHEKRGARKRSRPQSGTSPGTCGQRWHGSRRAGRIRHRRCGVRFVHIRAARRGAGESGMKNPSARTCSAGPILTSFLRRSRSKIQRHKSRGKAQPPFCAFRFTEDGRNINFSGGWNAENRGAFQHRNLSDVPPVRTKEQLMLD
jgi:hypothetical protein